MSLQTRVGAFISALGPDIKAIYTELAARLKASLTSTATIVTRDVELIVKQMTIPANSLRVGSVIRVVMFTQNDSVDITPRLRLGTAGTTADLQVGNSTSSVAIRPVDPHGIRIEFLLTVRAIGGSGVAACKCNMFAISGNSAVALGQQVNLPTSITTTLNTTVQNILSVSITQPLFTTAHAATECIIELLP